MFISPAYAQDAGGGGDPMLTFLPLILIFVVFYFLLIRPQQKKAKKHREMLTEIHRGDRIVTSGGLIGTVTRMIGDGELALEIADGVKVRIVRGMVSDVLSKGRGRGKQADEPDDADEDDDEEWEDEDEGAVEGETEKKSSTS